ncbi:hypothetical protein U1Q18_030320 [Sarracenia purpurea var. burkii]
MTSEVPGNSGRQCRNDSAKVVPIEGFYDDKGVHNNISIQTGEEFSPEFLRDRFSPRRMPIIIDIDQRLPKRGGFNYAQNNQLVYEDLTGLLGIRRRDSESGTDVSDFVPGNVYAADVEQKIYSGPPLYASDSPNSYQQYGSGVSDGSFSGKIKFLCSFGGRILPRPSDGKLRYVGGETRIISIRKNLTYSELVKKTSVICNQPHTIKYQLPGEDLDALISVSSDEDLHHMIEEYHDLERGSQRLRIFLVSSNEADSPCSFEARAVQQNDADYQYVVAVNGMLDPSPQKSSSGQSQSSQPSQWGSTVDYNSPTLQRDSPTSFQPLDIRNGSSSPNLTPTLSNQASQFFNTPQMATKLFNQSPPLSPVAVHHRDPKNRCMQVYEDHHAFSNGHERNSPYAMDKAAYDNAYRADATGQYYNHPHGNPQLFNYHHHNKHLVELNKMRFPNSSSSKESVSSPLYRHRDLDLGRPISDIGLSSENTISSSDDKMLLFPGPDAPIGSHIGMCRALSDSELELEGKPNHDLEHGISPLLQPNFEMEKSPSLAMSSSSQELQQQERISEKFQSGKNENLPTLKIWGHSKDNAGQDMLTWMDQKGAPSGWVGKHCDENGNPVRNPNDVEKNMINFYANSPQESQDPEGTSSGSGANALTDFSKTRKELLNDYHVNTATSDDFLDKSQETTNDQQDGVTNTIRSETASENSPRPHFLASQGSSLQEAVIASSENLIAFAQNESGSSLNLRDNYSPVTTDLCAQNPGTVNALGKEIASLDKDLVRHLHCRIELVGSKERSFVGSESEEVALVHSDRSDNKLQNNGSETAVVVEDVTDIMLPKEVPSSSSIIPLVQDPCDEISSPRETETESYAPESDFEDVKGNDDDKDESISDAAIAEMEAGIYGLQIIKNDDLEELRELGSGTFGTVYHGKWRGTDVAIKRIKKSCFAGRSSEQERLTKDFWREAQILSKLHHPNVVAFYGVVPDGPGGTLATVTEFMANGSLRHVLLKRDRKALDWRKKLIIAMDAAFGMEYLHLKNIVHFDLKCDNLLVNLGDPQRPVCKVGDFGLSRIKRNTLVSGGVRGTLPWMAPELLNGSSSRVSEKVDVFSFGITMWEILTGEEPYANMHCGAIIGGIVSNTLRPPIPDRCSLEWKRLMEDCWSPDPAARPSFTEITNQLRIMSMAVQPRRAKR